MLLFLAAIADENSRSKLEALYVKYRKDMFKVAYRVLNDYQLAQDAVHIAFIKLMDNLEKVDEIDCNKTRAFVVIIIRNVSINLYRKRKKQNNILLEDIEEIIPDNKEMVEEMIINAEMFSLVKSKVKELQPQYADIISLKYFYHYSDRDIAKLLDITHGNVRVRLHRAKQSLVKLLAQDRELSK